MSYSTQSTVYKLITFSNYKLLHSVLTSKFVLNLFRIFSKRPFTNVDIETFYRNIFVTLISKHLREI